MLVAFYFAANPFCSLNIYLLILHIQIVILISAHLRSHPVLLTSAWDEYCVTLGLDILFVALCRQSHSALTGMKLAVDLCTSPSQHLAGTKSKNRGHIEAFTE